MIDVFEAGGNPQVLVPRALNRLCHWWSQAYMQAASESPSLDASTRELFTKTRCSSFCSDLAEAALKDVCAYSWLGVQEEVGSSEDWMRKACAALTSQKGKWVTGNFGEFITDSE